MIVLLCTLNTIQAIVILLYCYIVTLIYSSIVTLFHCYTLLHCVFDTLLDCITLYVKLNVCVFLIVISVQRDSCVLQVLQVTLQLINLLPQMILVV